MSLNYTDIVAMIMNNENLQTVLDAMSEHLQAAVIIINDEMSIIAFSKAISVRDHYWTQALCSGSCSSEMLREIYDHPPAKNAPRSSEVESGFSYAPDHSTMKYYVSLPGKVFHHTTAFLAFPVENRFEKWRQELFLSFSCLVRNTYLWHVNPPLANSYQGHNAALLKLLDPDYTQSFQAETEESFPNNSSFFNNIQVLVLSPKFREINNMLLYALANSVCSLTSTDYTTIFDSSVVSIFQPDETTESHMEQLIRLAKHSNSTIGISWKFSGKEQVRRHYKQAAFSIEMARKMNMSGQLFTYDDMYVYSLVDRCHQRDRWAGIEHPVLTILKDYDTEHSSCLYNTLYYFLKCGMNSPLTAQKLGIHKSTLYHRIEVLKELIPALSTANANWQASVMLSFDLARLNSNQQ